VNATNELLNYKQSTSKQATVTLLFII